MQGRDPRPYIYGRDPRSVDSSVDSSVDPSVDSSVDSSVDWSVPHVQQKLSYAWVRTKPCK